MQATWYLTIAIGNLVVVIVSGAKIVDNQVWEYVIFAGLMSLGTILFIVLARFYKYEEDAQKIEDEIEEFDGNNEEKNKKRSKSIKSNSILPLEYDNTVSF